MTDPVPATQSAALAFASEQVQQTRNRLLATGHHALAVPLERALYALNYLTFTALHGTATPAGTTPHGHGPHPPRVIARIQILDPRTGRPHWLQHWNGFQLTTHWHNKPDRSPLTPAQSLRAHGGNIFDEHWEAAFRSWPPVYVAPEIVRSQQRAGLEAILLAPDRP